jgi:signal transduction histidine kinase
VDANDISKKAINGFINATAVMAVIPMLGFVYLIAARIGSLATLEGEAGYIVLAIMSLAVLGIVSGRMILSMLIKKIFEMQDELVRKQKLAAIAETVVALNHEIRNPLAIIMASLDLAIGRAGREELKSVPAEHFHVIKNNCDRICVVMDKMSRISKPSSVNVVGGIKMIDLPACELTE